MNSIERLTAIREHWGISSWTDMARRMGLKSAQVFYDVRVGNHDISRSMADKIVGAFPGLNWEWVFKGEGTMLASDTPSGVTVPLMDASRSEDTPYIKVKSVQIGEFYPDADMALCGLGDAMTEYPQDAVLVLKKMNDDALLIPGRIYVFFTGSLCLCRRYQTSGNETEVVLYASSDRRYPDGRLCYEPIILPKERITEVYSVIGWFIPSRMPNR
ncbi:MAG: hypothetical protein K2O78_08310 [Muribaculaceae bacterium]|nr:hypothetical protein [Muribaculaceae bacterium]